MSSSSVSRQGSERTKGARAWAERSGLWVVLTDRTRRWPSMAQSARRAADVGVIQARGVGSKVARLTAQGDARNRAFRLCRLTRGPLAAGARRRGGTAALRSGLVLSGAPGRAGEHQASGTMERRREMAATRLGRTGGQADRRTGGQAEEDM